MTASQLSWPLLAIMYAIFGSEDWTPQSFFKKSLQQGRHLLFLSDFPSNVTTEGSNIGDTVIVVFSVCVIICTEMHYLFVVGANFIASLTIWSSTSFFIKTVQTSKYFEDKGGWMERKLNIEHLREKYTELADLIKIINSMWSGLCFWLILDTSVWLSTDMDRAFKSNNYCLKVFNCFVYGYLASALVLSAESSKKVNRFIKANICSKEKQNNSF